ncbi:MAG: hypothetical protein ACRDF4_04260 [Rhabdochlamydiaceae bacterium]
MKPAIEIANQEEIKEEVTKYWLQGLVPPAILFFTVAGGLVHRIVIEQLI